MTIKGGRRSFGKVSLESIEYIMGARSETFYDWGYVQIWIWIKEEPKRIKKDKIYWWVTIFKAWMIVYLYDLDLVCKAHASSINLTIWVNLCLIVWKSVLSFLDLYAGSTKANCIYAGCSKYKSVYTQVSGFVSSVYVVYCDLATSGCCFSVLGSRT